MDSGMLPAAKGGKNQQQLGWSYGTDHPQMKEKDLLVYFGLGPTLLNF